MRSAMPSVLSDDYLHDEAKAYELVESVLWPDGPVCPHCGTMDRASPMKGKSTRIGAYKCYACRKKFTVKIGTIFEDSHIPMRTWLQAIYLMASSKKGISSNQLHRTFGVSLRSAWFMSHRIREAMRDGSLKPPPMGGGGGVVEVDETIYGRTATHPKGREKFAASKHKNIVLSLVERGGNVRSFHIENMSVSQIVPIVNANVSYEAHVMTDAARYYTHRLGDYTSHGRVATARTNTSATKRGPCDPHQHD